MGSLPRDFLGLLSILPVVGEKRALRDVDMGPTGVLPLVQGSWLHPTPTC